MKTLFEACGLALLLMWGALGFLVVLWPLWLVLALLKYLLF